MATENLQGVDGKPPSSKRPASSVTVAILSLPQMASTEAPGMGLPPERTIPLCVSAKANPARMKTSPVVRSMPIVATYNSHNTALLPKSANQSPTI
jgi:hypothetical protein